jgi:hypothetical protein
MTDYSPLFNFVENYAPIEFNGIDAMDHLMIDLEKMMEINDQFFYIQDLINMNIMFVSKRSFQTLGIDPVKLTPYYLFEARMLT